MNYAYEMIDKATAHCVAEGETDTLEQAKSAADKAANGYDGRYRLSIYSDTEEWFRFRDTEWVTAWTT